MRYLISIRRYRLPFRTPVRTAQGVWTEREGILLRAADEQGGVGFGEVAPIGWFGTESLDEAEEACRILNGNATDATVQSLPERLGCLRFALSAALQRGPEIPGEPKTALPVAALLPAGRLALSQVETKAEAGFRTFKWKVGVGDTADELAILDDLIAKLPEGGKLRLDANGAWERRRAERWLERCADRPIEFLEQPVAADAKGAEDLLLGLAGDYPTPVALDESVVQSARVDRWLARGWPGVFVVKPTLLGDAAAVLRRLAAAKATVVFSSALETAVGARTSLRLAFTHPGEPKALGFGVWPLFADARFDGPYLAPFLRWQDVQAINPEAVWNALS